VLNQSLKDYEFIIIDGASKDKTVDICKEYEKSIRIISEPDRGLYDAMNKGINISTGKWICFLNCGDTLHESTVLSKIKDILYKDNKIDFLYGDSIEKDTIKNIYFYKQARNDKYVWYGMFSHHQSMVYYLPIIKTYNLRYDVTYKYAADYDFTLRYLRYAKKPFYYNHPICIFLRGGVSQKASQKTLSEEHKIRISYGYNKVLCVPLLYLKIFINLVRRQMPSIYDFFRFRRYN
jgi:putative colanic acid biosynthesis glycosyltransferase